MNKTKRVLGSLCKFNGFLFINRLSLKVWIIVSLTVTVNLIYSLAESLSKDGHFKLWSVNILE